MKPRNTSEIPTNPGPYVVTIFVASVFADVTDAEKSGVLAVCANADEDDRTRNAAARATARSDERNRVRVAFTAYTFLKTGPAQPTGETRSERDPAKLAPTRTHDERHGREQEQNEKEEVTQHSRSSVERHR
jgi:hypothetical protein